MLISNLYLQRSFLSLLFVASTVHILTREENDTELLWATDCSPVTEGSEYLLQALWYPKIWGFLTWKSWSAWPACLLEREEGACEDPGRASCADRKQASQPSSTLVMCTVRCFRFRILIPLRCWTAQKVQSLTNCFTQSFQRLSRAWPVLLVQCRLLTLGEITS